MRGKVVITGGAGQLGLELQATAPAAVDLVPLDHRQFDLTDPGAVRDRLGSIRPDVILNAAAYTAVDRAEQEPERALAVNRDGPRLLAAMAAETGTRLVHISTDFVFDGCKSSPYAPDDAANPLGVYGRSKLAGEEAVLGLLRTECLIVRTSWLYAAHGGNFVQTMLRLLHTREELTVVADQVGTPTWARGLARALWDMVFRDCKGIIHWSDAGVASWYDFAVAIQEEGLALGLLKHKKGIKPVSSAEFPTAARRPAYSVLDKTETWGVLGYHAPHWRENLRMMLRELGEGNVSLCS